MIDQIRIFPVRKIRNWIDNSLEPFHSWSLISVTNTKEDSLTGNEKIRLKTILHCNDILQLQFGDFEPGKYYNTFTDRTEPVPERVLFNKKQAQEVIDFVNILQKKEEQETLVVHCMAGISRSGAIGTFINDILGLDLSTFLRNNPHTRPNSYVLKTLRDVYGFWGYE